MSPCLGLGGPDTSCPGCWPPHAARRQGRSKGSPIVARKRTPSVRGAARGRPPPAAARVGAAPAEAPVRAAAPAVWTPARPTQGARPRQATQARAQRAVPEAYASRIRRWAEQKSPQTTRASARPGSSSFPMRRVPALRRPPFTARCCRRHARPHRGPSRSRIARARRRSARRATCVRIRRPPSCAASWPRPDRRPLARVPASRSLGRGRACHRRRYSRGDAPTTRWNVRMKFERSSKPTS